MVPSAACSALDETLGPLGRAGEESDSIVRVDQSLDYCTGAPGFRNFNSPFGNTSVDGKGNHSPVVGPCHGIHCAFA